jgi:hypothetical protein
MMELQVTKVGEPLQAAAETHHVALAHDARGIVEHLGQPAPARRQDA